jgi:hypothetical protein
LLNCLYFVASNEKKAVNDTQKDVKEAMFKACKELFQNLLEGTDDGYGGPQAENTQRIESEFMAEVVMTQP